MRRLFLTAIAAICVLGLLPAGVAVAASQNEIVIAPLFDGTSPTAGSAPADPTTWPASAPAKHTPGLDSNTNNGVVRTWDQIAVRVDWDVNEADSTDTTLTVTLPAKTAGADVIWNPDNSGMFAGCGSGSTISADKLTLTCKLGDQAQGSHGAIRPTAMLRNGTDNATIPVSATITDSSGAAAASSSLKTPFTVSETPSGDWVKNGPVITPNPVTVNGVSGYVALFPIGLKSGTVTNPPTRGAGAVSTANPITFQDHGWALPAGAQIADNDQIAAANAAGTKIYGQACGSYDAQNKGKFPTTDGTWSCSTPTSQNNYPVWTMTVSGFSNTPPATNADGSNNLGYVITGQMVLWFPAAAVDPTADYFNSIGSDSANKKIAFPSDVTGIVVPGSDSNPVESGTGNNTVRFGLGTPSGGGGGGGVNGTAFSTTHYGMFASSYGRRINYTGNPVNQRLLTSLPTGSYPNWDGWGTISRGAPVNMQMEVGVTSGTNYASPIAGCMRWDPTQIKLSPMADYQLTTISQSGSTSYSTVSPNGPFSDLTVGSASYNASGYQGTYNGVPQNPFLTPLSNDDLAALDAHVEYGYETGATSYTDSVQQNSVECNNAGDRIWVDSKDASGIAAAKIPGTNTYKFDMVRVRLGGTFPWRVSTSNGAVCPLITGGFYLNVSGVVNDNLATSPNNKSIYLHTSRAIGAWDPTGGTKPPTTDCLPATDTTKAPPALVHDDILNDNSNNLGPTHTGWCNLPYSVAKEYSDPYTSLDPNSFTLFGLNGNTGDNWKYVLDSDTDRITIQGVRPGISKTNLAGGADIENNGKTVTFKIDMAAYGAKTEALTKAVFTDVLPANYQFVSIDSGPSTPGAKCSPPPAGTPGGSIVCKMTQDNPLTKPTTTDPRPQGLPGGWSDSITITVKVVNAVADPVSYAPITNTAYLTAGGLGPWDPANNTWTVGGAGPTNASIPAASASASSYLPLPSDQGAIVKAVDRELGGCTKSPMGDLTGAALTAWQARCSLIDLDTNASNGTTTDANGNMHFSLSYTNSGNTNLTNMRFVDVLPFNGDGTNEPASNSAANGASPSTVGDARTPASSYSGKVGLISVTGATTTWVTSAAPGSISRDPDKAVSATTWCSAVGGTRVSGPAGSCPATAYDVTAVYLVLPTLAPGKTQTAKLNLDTEGAACNDLWTNTFGARVNQINLPIRSNDVSIMTGCQSVGDFVWLDTNRDGLQNNDEPAVADVTVNLLNSAGKVVATTTTDANGYYSFKNLAPQSDYSIEFVPPTGMSLTKQDASGVTSNDPTADNTADPLSGTSSTATTHGDSDADVTTHKVSFTTPSGAGANKASDPATGTVADNPSLDAGFLSTINLELTKKLESAGPFEPGQTGIQFTLTPKNTGAMDSLGNWTVVEVPPAGMTITDMSGTGYTCVVASLTCTNSKPLAAGATANAITVTATLDADASYNTKYTNVAYVRPAGGDLAETKPLGTPPAAGTDTSGTATDNDSMASLTTVKMVSIGDYAWYDDNRNGVQDGTENPYPGMTVKLYDKDGNFIRSVVTDDDGYYYFDNLTPKTKYILEFVPKSGDQLTTQQVSTGTNATDSNPDPATGRTSVTTIALGNNDTGPNKADDPTIDAGVVSYNLALSKKLDTPGTILPGSTVTFTLTPKNTGSSTALKGWTVTDLLPTGLSLDKMEGVNPGDYDCTGNVCTANDVLPGKTTGPAIKITAIVLDTFIGDEQNYAYVAPSDKDVAETSPLGTPTTDPSTDPATTATDNDASAPITITSKVSVGDYVWWDSNSNGQQDAGEPGIDKVTVYLYDKDGKLVDTQETDADGYYAFKDLIPGDTYTIEFVSPTDATLTRPNNGDDRTDSDPDPTVSSGKVTFQAPALGSNNTAPTKTDDPTIDAGFVEMNLDLTKTLTSAAPYVPGQTVSYTLTPTNTGHTDAAAGWSVTDLLPAGMKLVKAEGTGYTCVAGNDGIGDTVTCTSTNTPIAGGDKGADITVTATIDAYYVGSLKNVAYVAPVGGDTPETRKLDIPKRGDNTQTSDTDNDAEASLTVKPVSIGDYVWWDANGDGIQNPGEDPISGVTVTIYLADGKTKVKDAVTEGGFYSFTDLAPGSDYVVVFTAPDGSTFTGKTAGSDTSVDSNPGPDGIAPVHTRDSGTNSATSPDTPTIDAGFVDMNLSLKKTLKSVAPFAPGQQVVFELVPHNSGHTQAAPGWSVTDLLPAGLTLVSAEGTGYDCTPGNDGTGDTVKCTSTERPLPADSDGDTITVTATIDAGVLGNLKNVAYVAPAEGDLAETILLDTPTRTTPTGTSDTDNDAEASLSVKPVSIGNYVWWDKDRDGVQDAGEKPVEGVTVTLYAADGTTVVATTTTDAKGFYSFAGLEPDTDYVVKFTAPEGAGFTDPTIGAKEGDSNPDSLGVANVHTPKQGDNSKTSPDDPTIDAGLVDIDLTLVKKLVTSGKVYTGDVITFTLTPHNAGSTDALAGWSVTDLLPKGLTYVSASGAGYRNCTSDQGAGTVTCEGTKPVPAGKDGPVLTVKVKVSSKVVGNLVNVAYIKADSDDITESNPLSIPDRDTDTEVSPTNNDSQAQVSSSGPRPGTDPQGGSGNGGGQLPETGASGFVTWGIPAGLGMLLAGAGLLFAGRRRRASTT